MLRALTTSLAFVLLAAAPESVFRADQQHSGVYPEAAARNFGGVQWRFSASGPIRASAAVARGTLYVGSTDGSMYALNAATGDVAWRFRATAAVDSTAAIAGARVLFQDKAGDFYALDASNGRLLWRFPGGAPIAPEFKHDQFSFWSSSPVVAGSLVVYGGIDGTLRALRIDSGRQVWRYQTPARIESSPAVADDLVYAGGGDGNLYAIELGTGKVRWRFATTGASQVSANCHFDCHSIRSSPVVAGGAVFFGARDGYLYAVDALSGALRWKTDHHTSWVNPSPGVAHGLVFAGTSDTHFIEALNVNDGSVAWRFTADGLVFASPAISGNELFECDFRGNLFALQADTGALLWRYKRSSSIISASPVIDGSRIYLGSDDGTESALNLTVGPPLRRYVYWDARYAKVVSYTRGVSGASGEDVRDYLAGRGYDVIDEAGLTKLLASQPSEDPSVVVFALDYLPGAALPTESGEEPLRRYLDAGGKVVWSGFPPLVVRRNLETGAMTGVGLDDAHRVLGVTFSRNLTAPVSALPTAAGRAWGLRSAQITFQQVPTSDVSTVLALDEDGFAGAWVKNYGGPAGTGFVFLPPPGLDVVPDENENMTFGTIQDAAEFRPLGARALRD